MNIEGKVVDAINEQINKEMYSSYLYLGMATWLEDQGYKGMSAWMRAQAKEEDMHAMKFYDYLMSRGARPVLKAIEAPPETWESPTQVFAEVYEHECKVSASIHALVKVAREADDTAADIFLQWFVSEQVEEEETAKDLVDKLNMIGDAGMGLYMVDREMSGIAAARASASASASGEA